MLSKLHSRCPGEPLETRIGFQEIIFHFLLLLDYEGERSSLLVKKPTSFDETAFYASTRTVWGNTKWKKYFWTFGKNNFYIVFQTEFHMSRGTFGRKFLCWQQIVRECVWNLSVFFKKNRQCCQNCIVSVQENLKKIRFLKLLPFFLQLDYSESLKKTPPSLAKLRYRWPEGRNDWKQNEKTSFFFQLLLKVFLGGSKLHFTSLKDFFQEKWFLKKILHKKNTNVGPKVLTISANFFRQGCQNCFLGVKESIFKKLIVLTKILFMTFLGTLKDQSSVFWQKV